MEYNTEEYYKELEKNKNRIISNMCKLYGSDITLRSEKLHALNNPKITESYSIIKDESVYWKIEHRNNICKTPIGVLIEMKTQWLAKIKSTHKKEIIKNSDIVCPEDIINPSHIFYVNKKCTDINKIESIIKWFKDQHCRLRYPRIVIDEEYKISLEPRVYDYLPDSIYGELPDYINFTNAFYTTFYTNTPTTFNRIPRIICGDFVCREGDIKSLVGMPEIILGNCYLDKNSLTSLNGISKEIYGDLDISNNSLLTTSHINECDCILHGKISSVKNTQIKLNEIIY